MILQEIVSRNREGLEERKRALPFTEIVKTALGSPVPSDFARAIGGGEIRLIAEVKKASPSRGTICADFDPVKIALEYAGGGAAAVSVLTEPNFFQGSLNSLARIKNALTGKGIPLLRKDFIFDPYQVYESRVYGADAVLLIAAMLTPERLREFLRLSHALGMKCLVEAHNEREIETALQAGAEIIGINNRDLDTFKVDTGTTRRLCKLIPPGRIVVSESGLKTREDIAALKEIGVNAVLIGEALMAAPDIREKIKEIM